MTEKTIPVYVEWALQGKTLGRAGSRVLACSNGTLSMENFTELIGRFSLGTPDKLPQVSVSYLPSGSGPSRVYYLGMASHKWAADVQTDGGELLERDDDNRPVAVTTYFCVPYQPLADAAVSYQAMYQEFDNIRLGTASGSPLQVEFPVRTGLPAINALAVQSAGRLFSGRPVCVLGAESTTVAERLEFIGAVAALLPYGFRTRLTAATWVRPTHRDHRFRLFFSAAKRDADPPDGVVYWGDPQRTALTLNDDLAHVYDRWLADTVGQLERLARLTTPRSFNREDVLESMDEIGVLHPEPDEREPEEQAPRRLAPFRTPRGAKRIDGEQILRDCASCMQTAQAHLPDLHIAITRLTAQDKSRISPEERRRYQEIIKEEHLFRRDEALGNLQAKLRDALLKAAFIPPLGYPDYCLIEDSLGAGSPDPPLLRMIAGMGMSDMRIRAVVYPQLPEKLIREELDNWYISAKVNAVELINAVAGTWHRPHHAFYASLTAADFMSQMVSDSDLIREVLQHHGYLGPLLQTVGEGHDNTQVYVLNRFLKTAYPYGLSEREIRQILIESAEPPSPALLAAVLLRLARLADAQLVQGAYVSRTVQAMNLKPEMLEVLESRLASANGWPGSRTAGRDPHPVTDQT